MKLGVVSQANIDTKGSQGVLQYTVGGDWVQPLPSHGIGPPDDPHPVDRRMGWSWGASNGNGACLHIFFSHAKLKEKVFMPPNSCERQGGTSFVNKGLKK